MLFAEYSTRITITITQVDVDARARLGNAVYCAVLIPVKHWEIRVMSKRDKNDSDPSLGPEQEPDEPATAEEA